jgi:uncharacterized membrane protein YkvA (DUF1232 family)
MLDRLKNWAGEIKLDILALYLAARDPRVPWYAKALAALIAAYALSPIDPIPDFIPVLGYLDELILLPLGIVLVVRLIPGDVMEDLRRQAEARINDRPRSAVGAAFVILLWVSTAALAVWFIMKRD